MKPRSLLAGVTLLAFLITDGICPVPTFALRVQNAGMEESPIRGKLETALRSAKNVTPEETFQWLSYLVLKSDQDGWKHHANSVPDLSGYPLGTSTRGGRFSFNPVPAISFPWHPLGLREEGWVGTIERSETRRNFFEFTVRFDKAGRPSFRKTFQIGSHKRPLTSRKDKSTLEVLDISDRLGVQMLAETMGDPESFEVKILAKKLPDFRGLHLGSTNTAGRIEINFLKRRVFNWTLLGRAEKGWEAIITSQKVKGKILELTVRLRKEGQEIFKTFQIHPAFARTLKSPMKGVRPLEVLEIDDRLGLKGLSEVVLKPANFDWNAAAEQLPNLAGLLLGSTDETGDLNFTPIPKFRFPWNALGMHKKDWKAVVISSGVRQGHYELTVRFTKGNRSIRKTFQIGYFTTFLRNRRSPGSKSKRVLDISDQLGLRAVAELVKGRQVDLRRLEGLRLGQTYSDGDFSFSPIPHHSFRWRIRGSEQRGWEAHIAEAKREETYARLMVKLTKKNKRPIFRTFQVGPTRRTLHDQRRSDRGNGSRSRKVLDLIHLETLIGMLEAPGNGIKKDGGHNFTTQQTEALDSSPSPVDGAMASEIFRDLDQLLKSLLTDREREIATQIVEGEDDSSIVNSNGFTRTEVSRVREQLQAGLQRHQAFPETPANPRTRHSRVLEIAAGLEERYRFLPLERVPDLLGRLRSSSRETDFRHRLVEETTGQRKQFLVKILHSVPVPKDSVGWAQKDDGIREYTAFRVFRAFGGNVPEVRIPSPRAAGKLAAYIHRKERRFVRPSGVYLSRLTMDYDRDDPEVLQKDSKKAMARNFILSVWLRLFDFHAGNMGWLRGKEEGEQEAMMMFDLDNAFHDEVRPPEEFIAQFIANRFQGLHRWLETDSFLPHEIFPAPGNTRRIATDQITQAERFISQLDLEELSRAVQEITHGQKKLEALHQEVRRAVPPTRRAQVDSYFSFLADLRGQVSQDTALLLGTIYDNDLREMKFYDGDYLDTEGIRAPTVSREVLLQAAELPAAGLEKTALFDERVDGNLIARDLGDAALLVFQAGEKTLTRLLETLQEKLWKRDPRWQGTFKISHIDVLTLRAEDEEVGITEFLENILREPLMNASDSVVGQHYPSLNSMEIRIRAFIQRGELRIEVVDNGLGISPEILSQLGKAEVSTKRNLDWTRGQSGHGILESTRKASEHGWRLTVTNHSDEAKGGAVATLAIPLAEPAETPLAGLEEVSGALPEPIRKRIPAGVTNRYSDRSYRLSYGGEPEALGLWADDERREVYLAQNGPLLFMDWASAEQGGWRQDLEKVPGLLWVRNLLSSELGQGGLAVHTHATVAAVRHAGSLEGMLTIESGAGFGIPSLVAKKEQGASFAVLLEDDPISAGMARLTLKDNGLVEGKDFVVIETDIRNVDEIARQLQALGRKETRAALISNIGDWEIYSVNNQDSMRLIPVVEQATGARVTLFVGGGYLLREGESPGGALQRDLDQVHREFGFTPDPSRARFIDPDRRWESATWVARRPATAAGLEEWELVAEETVAADAAELGSGFRVAAQANLQPGLAGRFGEARLVTISNEPEQAARELAEIASDESVAAILLDRMQFLDEKEALRILPVEHGPAFLLFPAEAHLFTPAVAAALLRLQLPANRLLLLKLKQEELGIHLQLYA